MCYNSFIGGTNMDKKIEQHFNVLSVPCRKAFIIDGDKKEEFLSQEADPIKREMMDDIVSKLNINNLIEGPTLVKKRVFNKK